MGDDVKKVRIIRGNGRFYAGSMPAAVGMKLLDSSEEIVRVNAKSVVARNEYGGEFRYTDTKNISVTEARRFGWKE